MLGILLILAAYVLSYLVTCGIVWLVTLCFGWSFSWLIATGVWLIMLLVSAACK